MMINRKRVAAVGVMSLLAVGAPAATASAEYFPGDAPCTDGPSGSQGGTAGTETKVCQGGGLVFVAPSVGQVATVIGPTVIGPSGGVNAVVSAGSVNVP